LAKAFIEVIGCNVSIFFIFVLNDYETLILASLHERFPEVSLRPKRILKNVSWVDLEVGLITLAFATDSNCNIHVYLETNLLIHIALDGLFHFILGERPVRLVCFHFHQDDVGLFEKPDHIEDILLETSHLVLDVDFYFSDIVGVINNNFLLFFGLGLNVLLVSLFLSIIVNRQSIIFFVFDCVTIDLLTFSLLWVLLLFFLFIFNESRIWMDKHLLFFDDLILS
jgi:hypothetical protein